jgi:ectoine hydroxylase-related dioxygenase (phytanoyl-CoA dioxygenase family)
MIKNLSTKGFSIVNDFYNKKEIDNIIDCIENHEKAGDSFLKTKDLFAVRQLLVNVPALAKLLFTNKLNTLLSELFGSTYFLTKSIYFDKPEDSNWFVNFHQDLSISVNVKQETTGYKNWTFKKGQHGVQPPVKFLDQTITVRIHLDDTDKNNGALKVIPKSHLNGVIRQDSDEWTISNQVTCDVKHGGIMLMKPLTLHASNKSTSNKRRRVIHLEFNTFHLDAPLEWLEYQQVLSY